VAAIGNLGMQLFHFRDASIMVLFWHLGSVAAISGLAACLGDRVIGRPRAGVVE
jgi:hypothetical protein